jgi:hypothetical protein
VHYQHWRRNLARAQIRTEGSAPAQHPEFVLECTRVCIFSIVEITDWTQGGRYGGKLGEDRRVGVGRRCIGNDRRLRGGPAEGTEALCVQLRRAEPRKSIIQNGSSGKVQIPVGFFLIRQPKGDVLFDCGNNDKIITDPYYWGPFVKALDPGRSPDIAIDAQLAKINVKPADIKYVVLGHFHVDHAGKIGKFLDSRDAEGADIICAHEPSKLTSTRPNFTSERMPRSLRPTPQTRAS